MEDVADLQLQWQRAIRLQDQVGTALLEAWASTSAANEILETFTNQGLQETTDHPPISNMAWHVHRMFDCPCLTVRVASFKSCW